MKRRLAVLLPQLPHDPASGAARHVRTIAEMLAIGDYDVRCLGTTATERGRKQDTESYLDHLGHSVKIKQASDHLDCFTHSFSDRNVDYCLLDVGTKYPGEWEQSHGKAFDRIWDKLLRDFDPQLVITYGARTEDRVRHQMAIKRGCKLFFSLNNTSYDQPGVLKHTTGVFTPSKYLTDWYQKQTGIVSTPLPTPIDPVEVIAPNREALFITFVNPGVEKGLMFFVRLAEQIAIHRPDIPILIIEGRGTSEDVIGAASMGRFDLRKYQNIMITPPVSFPRDIFAATRVLLVPSVCNEAAGRVAVEALVNGVPPIVSNRGGLSEVVGVGGFVLPLPTNLTMESPRPVQAHETLQWRQLIERLVDDEAFYASASYKATGAGKQYLPEFVTKEYGNYFNSYFPK